MANVVIIHNSGNCVELDIISTHAVKVKVGVPLKKYLSFIFKAN